jgi:type II secretory pathway component PulM
MIIIENLKTYLKNVQEKTFYQYLAGALGIIVLLCGLIFFFYFRSVSHIKKEISNLNDSRERAKEILDKAEKVQKQRAAVDTILAQEPDFKIAGYVSDLLAKANLKPTQETAADGYQEGNYLEKLLTIQLQEITMRDLTALLDEIEQKERLYLKELDINKSKKSPKTIDVTMTIATLLPKPKTTE